MMKGVLVGISVTGHHVILHLVILARRVSGATGGTMRWLIGPSFIEYYNLRSDILIDEIKQISKYYKTEKLYGVFDWRLIKIMGY
jgi:hypothetical protein